MKPVSIASGAVGVLDLDRVRVAAEPVGRLVDDDLVLAVQAVGGHQPGDAGSDDRDLSSSTDTGGRPDRMRAAPLDDLQSILRCGYSSAVMNPVSAAAIGATVFRADVRSSSTPSRIRPTVLLAVLTVIATLGQFTASAAAATGGAGGVEEGPGAQQHAVRPSGDVGLVRRALPRRQRAGDRRPGQARGHRHRLRKGGRRRQRLEPVQPRAGAGAAPRRAQRLRLAVRLRRPARWPRRAPPPRRLPRAPTASRSTPRATTRASTPPPTSTSAPCGRRSAPPSRSPSPPSPTSTTTRPSPTRSSSGPAARPSTSRRCTGRRSGTSVRAVFEHTYLYNRIYGHPIYPLGQTYESPGRGALKLFRRFAASFGGLAPSWWSWQETSGREWGALGARSAARPLTGYRLEVEHPLLKRGQQGRHGRLGAAAPGRGGRGRAGHGPLRQAHLRCRAFLPGGPWLTGRRPYRHRHLGGAAPVHAVPRALVRRAGAWPGRRHGQQRAPGEPAAVGLAAGARPTR